MEEVPTSVLSAERCHLGEGPTYDASTDTAWWFDIRERRLFEHRFADGRTVIHELPKMASALARIDGERQLVLTDDGLYVRQVADGRMELFAALEADNPATRSNDARVHPSGTFWLGTMGRQAEQGAGAIYALHRGRITQLYPDITIPNAICFSPGGDIGYFADTARNVLYRVPLDAATGLPVGQPAVLIQHHGTGGLDGAVVDADGRIWNARWGGGCVDVYDPRGKRLRSLRVPASQSSCPAFVGRDFSRVLVTSAWQDMDDAQRAADPGHGRTFLLDAAARGRAEPDVKLS
ncbi:SMP-30/gluconolactonase/LRE family protein [Bradyrhizobium septentrionale]|uniref:SMP-30/gluconolactonase/LRE family protein n=1 Tax=Bradyrhizobium septentrionale TaxID=1404411 RepID=A0A973W745_9BRAD|nr:SMP-30/gluconolactonase/LRE family protein [Bradyrhizobium septentrionale]UGY20459.1 SMP-30/gluconolactonase/LRE family protein [Bradyrhizobium septentrionale]UGY29458.1 SMP-30/gluconolactonase/LRE family protein [Bradyrhizobium septentrionale]